MMGVLNFIFVICSLRTNITYFIILLAATVGLDLLAASYWEASANHFPSAHRLQIVSFSLFIYLEIRISLLTYDTG
jgi:hypothetical protein